MFRQQLTPDTRTGYRGIIVAALIAAIVGLMVSTIPSKPLDPAVAAQVAKNQEIFATCEVIKKCFGGFVRRKDGMIIRMDNCGKGCGRYTWDFHDMKTLFLSGMTQNIDAVILPGDPAWPATAAEHARQFVEK